MLAKPEPFTTIKSGVIEEILLKEDNTAELQNLLDNCKNS